MLTDLLAEEAWIALRDQALTPQIVTDLATTEQTRRELIEGAQMLGLTELLSHQLLAADMLNAGHEINAIMFPRQSAKTETMIAVVLGRCQERPKYNAAFSLTTMAAKTSEVFDDRVMFKLETAYPDPDTRPFKVYRGKGSEHVRWPNGSKFSAKTPRGAAFRGSSYDLVWLDEAGEATPDQGADLNGGILPTFDTRDGGQLVYTGTAGKYRKGLLLWDGLQNPDAGKLAYYFPDDLTEDNLAAWEPTPEHPYAKVRQLIEVTHPGVHSGLTKLETVRRRSEALTDRAQFGREYGGIFGAVGEGTTAVSPSAWGPAMRAGVPALPSRLAIAACSNWGGSNAAIVAAWRDESGRAYGYVLDHRPGTSWLGIAAAEFAVNLDVPVVWDTASSDVRAEVHVMRRMNPAPRIADRGFKEVTSAAATLIADINNGNAVHFDQPAMNAAAKTAVRRSTGASSWALGPGKEKDADISALTAWALALEYYDANPHYEMVGPIMG
ncbi:hypothetical protein RWH45_10610 [Microbacterium sp. KSW4-17]|uniref:Terminase n=1 Tax=Microbacterium galbum TaxID=3075994 RepID=A0ABU3T8F6_9MICO|nr:hypothetical protein [Microbacterium sp. KSW4-17]MDU0367669.1 hypothetical protein [Microbacterium sp. KSW4-17]